MSSTTLFLSWSVSKGRDTYGYNITRLDDVNVGKRYRCNGGGYDMVGTVLGMWLQEQHQERLMEIKKKAYHKITIDKDSGCRVREENSKGLYGMAYIVPLKKVCLDGACGVDSIIRIAEAIGLQIKYMPTVGRSRTSKGFIVTDTRSE